MSTIKRRHRNRRFASEAAREIFRRQRPRAGQKRNNRKCITRNSRSMARRTAAKPERRPSDPELSFPSGSGYNRASDPVPDAQPAEREPGGLPSHFNYSIAAVRNSRLRARSSGLAFCRRFSCPQVQSADQFVSRAGSIPVIRQKSTSAGYRSIPYPRQAYSFVQF
jgi:hypothetical protein